MMRSLSLGAPPKLQLLRSVANPNGLGQRLPRGLHAHLDFRRLSFTGEQQRGGVSPFVPGSERPDALDVHDRRSVDARELLGMKPTLNRRSSIPAV